VKAAEVWCILDVETSGCGFLDDRRPRILYERHVFYRLTKGKFKDDDVSNPTPGGYGALGAHQYDRLLHAISLDRTAALKSASWGLGQVMGEYFRMAGFPDVETMVSAMTDSEDLQLQAMASYLISKQLHLALRNHDWAAFARGYNGPDYAKNQYDVRLKGDFQKLSYGTLPDLDVRAAQLYLTFAGYHPGGVDGNLGRLTRAALSDFRGKNKLKAGDTVDVTVLKKLSDTVLA
jgi:hypothetical protein